MAANWDTSYPACHFMRADGFHRNWRFAFHNLIADHFLSCDTGYNIVLFCRKMDRKNEETYRNYALYNSIYMWMYNNLNLWGDTNEKRDAAILVIRNGLVNLTLVGIPEIALSASLVELTNL